MSKHVSFVLRVDSRNSGVADAPDIAICDILRGAAEEIENGHAHRCIRDVNGNLVGHYDLHVVEEARPS